MSRRASATVALAGVAVLGLGLATASAQTPDQNVTSGEHDTLSVDLLQLRLARLRLDASSLADTLAEDDRLYLATLLDEADSAYRSGDLDLASVRLLEAEIYLGMFEGEDGGAAGEESDDLLETPEQGDSPFGLEVLAGVDLWKEQFASPDRSFQESEVQGSGNPLAGLRADFSGTGGFGTLQSYAEARYSRDYAFALLDADLSGAPTRVGRPRVELRLSGTDYRSGVGTDYLQTRVRARWELGDGGGWSLAPTVELWDTRYAKSEGSFFVSFREGAYGLLANFSLPVGLWLETEARRVARRYSADSQPDFRGFDLWTNAGYAVGQFTSAVWLAYQTRDFSSAPLQWLSSASYRDVYLNGRLRWLFRRPWGVELRTSLEKRHYLVSDPATPDFVEATIRLALVWEQGFNREVSAGPVVRWRTSPEFPGASWSRWEDYRSWGLALDVELLQGVTWSLHLANTFESRAHPYGPPGGFRGLTLYDDRFITSSLLLFSWHFSQDWEVTATVNLDREDDRRQSEGDVQSTLLSLQFSRKIF